MRTPKKSRIRFLRFEKSSRTSRLNFDEFFSSSSNQTAQQPLIVTTSTPCHPIVIDPQSIHPYEKKDETFQQLQVHISKLILYHDVHTGYVNVKVSVCNKTISFASVSAEKVNHEYGVCTLFQFQLGKNAVFPAIETSEMMSAFEVESNVAVFNTKAVGKFNICCETLTTNGIIKNAVPILVENKKVGEIEVSFYSKVEGFLDDSASEDSDQASASPTPMPSR